MRQALTFDDVQIVPTFSTIVSRSEVDLSSKLTRNFRIKTPIIAAPMDTVCETNMTMILGELGAAGCLHRFCSIDEQVNFVRKTYSWYFHRRTPLESIVIAAVGATGDYEERTERLVAEGAQVILIDVAHGDHIHVKNALAWMNALSYRSKFDVIAGNIATYEAAQRLEDWGADALRVGIGGGSMCTTRVNTGIGVPQLEAILDITENYSGNIPVISDGGIRYPGDMAKALAAGADTVMLGGMFAGTNEAPGEVITTGNWPYEKRMKLFRGSASLSAKQSIGGPLKHIEGASRMVDAKGSVTDVIMRLTDGLRSAMSYVGASTLLEFVNNANFVQITHAGQVEAQPHGMR